MRDQGSKLLEERVVCDAVILKETVKQTLGSDRKFAAYLGVSRGTAREYRLRRFSLPRSFFEKLQALNPALRPLKTTDAFWGQRKGGTLHAICRKSLHIASGRCKSCSLHSREGRSRQDRPLSTVLAEMGAYDTVPPQLILETALAGHRPALAEFVGRIFGDGSPIIAPTYSASEIESQQRMQSLVAELFDYKPEIKVSKGNYRMQLRRICGHTLKLLGIPLGRKSLTNPSVPTFIMESSEPTIWLSFLREIFDDEAYVSERGIEIGLAASQMKRFAMSNNVSNSRILDQVAELLDRLGIQYVRRKGQVYRVGETNAICWFLRIPRREFRRVRDLGLFYLPQKLQRLNAAL